jgi:hypothetical protein
VSNNFIQYSPTYTQYIPGESLSMPAPSAVRVGVNYSSGLLGGTCSIPPISAVTIGCAYDSNYSKVGIAYNSSNIMLNSYITTISAANSMGVRLKRAVTVDSTGHTIASFSN